MNHQSYGAVVVGAGIWGCTVARTLAERGENVLVLERGKKIGGACSSHFDRETGDEVHDHGPHIFHTEDARVWGFVNRFAEFNGYRHYVVALSGGSRYRLPVCLDLLNKFFGTELGPAQAEEFMSSTENMAAVFDAFFRGYSTKQWGSVPGSSVTGRVRVSYTHCPDYFTDRFQGIPVDGYQAMFRRMLDHWRITVRPRTFVTSDDSGGRLRLVAGGEPLPEVPVYCSAPVDELFGYRHGGLPYRTAEFRHERVERPLNGCPVLNFSDLSRPETRCTEWRYFHPESLGSHGPAGIVTYETPMEWSAGCQRYWPVVDELSSSVYERYRYAADNAGIIVGGRLGGFKYLDMDETVSDALKAAGVLR